MFLAGYWGMEKSEEFSTRLSGLTGNQPIFHHVAKKGEIVVWKKKENHPGLVIPLVDEDKVCGVSAGRIFSQQSRSLPKQLPLEALTASSPKIASILWGDYLTVAFPRQGDDFIIARDPLGLSNFFLARHKSGYLFASRMTDLVDLIGSIPSFDWDYLKSLISHGPLPTIRTGFKNVRKLHSGTYIHFSSGKQKEGIYWSAFDAVKSKSPATSVEQIRETLKTCVHSWLGSSSGVYLDLSGGLDSAAIAWAAATSGSSITAGHVYFGEVSASNELAYARKVADHLNVRLEIINGKETLPFTPSKHEPYRWDEPVPDITRTARTEVQTMLAGSSSTLLSGVGGDQVFFSRPAIPWHLHDHALLTNRIDALSQVLQCSRQTGLPLVNLLGSIASQEYLRWVSPRTLSEKTIYTIDAPGWLKSTRREAKRLVSEVLGKLPGDQPRLPAGKLYQINSIISAAGTLDRERRSTNDSMLVYPMLSQPLVELALNTVVPNLIDEKQDRIYFRAAMSDVLPAEVIQRQSKGDYTGMQQRGIRRNFKFIKELVLEGQAVSQDIVDSDQVVNELTASALSHSEHMWSLHYLLIVELWIRSWAR